MRWLVVAGVSSLLAAAIAFALLGGDAEIRDAPPVRPYDPLGWFGSTLL
jgi:hypothetical protein